MKGSVTRWARRSIGIFDAGISSIGNLAVSIAAARALSLDDFGLVSVTVLTGIITVGVARSFWGDPFTLRSSGLAASERARDATQAVTSACAITLLVAPLIGAIMTAVALLSGADSWTAFALGASLAAVAPLLILQDVARQISYGTDRPVSALGNTVAWTAILVAALAVPLATGRALPSWLYVLFWGMTAGLGAAVGFALLRIMPRLANPLPWIRQHAKLVRRLVSDYALTQVTSETSIVLISILAGAAEAGLIRKAQIPLAPLVIMTSGIIAVTQPALVRRVAGGAGLPELRRFAYQLGFACIALSLMLGLAVAAVPESFMQHLVGHDWAQARVLVPILALYLGLGALAACQGITLRAFDRIGEQVRLRLILLPVILVAVASGASFGALTAAVALCVSLLSVCLAWAALLARPAPSEQEPVTQ